MRELDNNKNNLNVFQKILFWSVFLITILSVLSYLLNPYISIIKLFQINITHIYLLLILIAISSLNLLKKFKWGDKEFEFDKNMKEEVKELSDISTKVNPKRLPRNIKIKIDEFENGKEYVEGIIYFFNEIERIIKSKMKELIKSSNFISIINQALQDKMINEYDYYDIIRLNNVRNTLIHDFKLNLNENDLIKLLYLSADVFHRIGGKKNE